MSEFSFNEPVEQRSRGALVAAVHADDALTWDDLPINPRTKAMYKREFAAFTVWCDVSGVTAKGASARSVSQYLEYLVKVCGRAIATVDRVRAAISVGHEMAFSAARTSGRETPPNPARDILVRATLARLTKELLDDGVAVESPKREIRYDELVQMVESEPLTLSGRRNRALLAVTWFGMFRRSEVAALDMRALRPREGRRPGYEITLRSSKANKRGEPEIVALSRRDDLEVCPDRELRAWLAISRISSGAVFRRVYPTKSGGRVGESALTPSVIATIVQAAAARIGIPEPREFGAHSLRSGSATELSAENISTDRLMSKGRWRSLAAARRYIRTGDALANDPMRTILRDRAPD